MPALYKRLPFYEVSLDVPEI